MRNEYFDIHSHILPGVDDGSKSMEMSMQMIDAAYAQGVRKMIATPHFYPGHHNAEKERLEDLYREMVVRISETYNDFTLLLGNEIYYKDEVIELLRKGRIFTLAGTRYILIEFSVTADFRCLYDAVYRCVNAGFIPVIAHVERYQCLFGKEEKIAELIGAGAYIQVNAENFEAGLINPARKRAMKLIHRGFVHFLGSDCHNMQDRKPDLGPAAEYIQKKMPGEICEKILRDNPQQLLQDQYI